MGTTSPGAFSHLRQKSPHPGHSVANCDVEASWGVAKSEPQEGDTARSTLVAGASASSWRLGASDGAEPGESLSITDVLVVDDDGRHHSNLPRCARRCRRLLGVAINAVAATAAVAGHGDDAAAVAAAVATANAQVEPATRSSPPILPWQRLAFEWRRLCSRCHRCVGRTLGGVAGGISHRCSRAWPSPFLVRRSSFRTSGT